MYVFPYLVGLDVVEAFLPRMSFKPMLHIEKMADMTPPTFGRMRIRSTLMLAGALP